jgi:hypothetical protein
MNDRTFNQVVHRYAEMVEQELQRLTQGSQERYPIGRIHAEILLELAFGVLAKPFLQGDRL